MWPSLFVGLAVEDRAGGLTSAVLRPSLVRSVATRSLRGFVNTPDFTGPDFEDFQGDRLMLELLDHRDNPGAGSQIESRVASDAHAVKPCGFLTMSARIQPNERALSTLVRASEPLSAFCAVTSGPGWTKSGGSDSVESGAAMAWPMGRCLCAISGASLN